MPSHDVKHTILVALLFFCSCFLAGGCGQQDTAPEQLPTYANSPLFSEAKPVYRFAVHPLGNPKRVFAAYQPLVDAMNRKVDGFQVKLVASRDYAAFARRLCSAGFDLALANPLQTSESLQRGYHVVARMGDGDDFRGLIVVRRDSSHWKVSDLAGAPLSFPASMAFAATILPKVFLQSHGLNLQENNIRYVGSDESALMDVYFGKTVAAGTWPQAWQQFTLKHPEIAATLQVQWKTEPFITNAVVIKNSMPEEHAQQLINILLQLQKTSEGRTLLADIHLSSFEKSSDEDYALVAKFMEHNANIYPAEFCPGTRTKL